jgi:hypothetical protein
METRGKIKTKRRSVEAEKNKKRSNGLEAARERYEK